MQAFIYCRVSSEEQANDNHYSLENQEICGRDCCKSKGLRVADVRKDVASGKDTNRDGFQDLIKAIERANCKMNHFALFVCACISTRATKCVIFTSESQ
jgi:DNA invertase Pin-like site-specific DNA recombinase